MTRYFNVIDNLFICRVYEKEEREVCYMIYDCRDSFASVKVMDAYFLPWLASEMQMFLSRASKWFSNRSSKKFHEPIVKKTWKELSSLLDPSLSFDFDSDDLPF